MSYQHVFQEMAVALVRPSREVVAVLLALTLMATIGTSASAAELSLRSDEYVIFHHHDALGSTVATTGADGEVLWFEDNEPYGRSHGRRDRSNAQLDDDVTGQFEEDGYSRPGYTGHVRDGASGLVYMQARFYDPELGRFLSIDPVGFTPSNTTSFNRYAYANNNPYKYVDPDGRFAFLAIPAAIEGVALFKAAAFGISATIAGYGLSKLDDNVLNENVFHNESNESVSDSSGDSGNPNDSASGDDNGGLSSGLLGNQSHPNAGQRTPGTGRHTSGVLKPENGGSISADGTGADAWKDFETLTGGNYNPTPEPGTGHIVGDNGVRYRPRGETSGPRIEVPSDGDRPHEGLHY